MDLWAYFIPHTSSLLQGNILITDEVGAEAVKSTDLYSESVRSKSQPSLRKF
jgi:hypothetical protein